VTTKEQRDIEHVEKAEHEVGLHAAEELDDFEHTLTIRQALWVYRKAILSVIVSMCTIMESYDIQIISSFFAYPSFKSDMEYLLVMAIKFPATGKSL
jgi:SP family general alpha glucoside:H+ symporter-like MFS transporter